MYENMKIYPLDVLIDQGVKPKNDVEYLYRSDLAFPIYDEDDD